MLTKRLPYSDIEDIDILKMAMCSLKQVPLPKEAIKIPARFRKVLGAMLQVDPDLRPNIDQIIQLISSEGGGEGEGREVNIEQLKEMKSKLVQTTPIYNNKLSLPPLPPLKIQRLDENTKISLALLLVNYPHPKCTLSYLLYLLL